jgi:hypothetical protein
MATPYGTKNAATIDAIPKCGARCSLATRNARDSPAAKVERTPGIGHQVTIAETPKAWLASADIAALSVWGCPA